MGRQTFIKTKCFGLYCSNFNSDHGTDIFGGERYRPKKFFEIKVCFSKFRNRKAAGDRSSVAMTKTFEETIVHDFEEPSTYSEQVHYNLYDQREKRLCSLDVGLCTTVKGKIWSNTTEMFAFERHL